MTVKEKILDALNKFLAKIKNIFVAYNDVVDNCASTSTDLPLSANQGKVIQEEISELNMKNANYEIRTISGTTDSAGYIAIGELSETYAPVAVVSLTKWRRVSAISTTEKYYAYISEWGSETSMPGVDISLLCIFAKV